MIEGYSIVGQKWPNIVTICHLHIFIVTVVFFFQEIVHEEFCPDTRPGQNNHWNWMNKWLHLGWSWMILDDFGSYYFHGGLNILFLPAPHISMLVPWQMRGVFFFSAPNGCSNPGCKRTKGFGSLWLLVSHRKMVNGGSSSQLFGKEDILFGYLWCPHKMSCTKNSPVSTSFPASTRSHDFIKRTSFTYGFEATRAELRSEMNILKGHIGVDQTSGIPNVQNMTRTCGNPWSVKLTQTHMDANERLATSGDKILRSFIPLTMTPV